MNTRLNRLSRLATVMVTATIGLTTLGAGNVDAGMAGAAAVTCNGAYNPIEVTPRVTSDHADQDQYTATRVWVGTWNSATQRWSWQAHDWKVEVAGRRNNPMGGDVSRLTTQSFRAGDGYHYVYVESFMWNGQSWYGHQGQYTTSYTLVTPSVSHEPAGQQQGSYCTL